MLKSQHFTAFLFYSAKAPAELGRTLSFCTKKRR